MDTTINAKEQGWIDGVTWILVQRHFYAPDELIGRFDLREDAERAEADLDEVARGMALVLNPDGNFF